VILKSVLLFLVLMLALGMFGKLRRAVTPKGKSGGGDAQVQTARKCPSCGTYLIGETPSRCAQPDCPSRSRS
jgi:hypothetical protein